MVAASRRSFLVAFSSLTAIGTLADIYLKNKEPPKTSEKTSEKVPEKVPENTFEKTPAKTSSSSKGT